MQAVRTTFDGQKIIIPPELEGVSPGEVIVIFDTKPRASHSIWDVVARARGTRTAEDIDRQIQEERADWNDA